MHSEGLITQVQLALIGIILVIGLFFLWRAVGRIEEKLDKVFIAVNTPQVCKREPTEFHDENAFAEKLMNDVFAQQPGGATGFVFVNPVTESEPIQGEGLVEITEEEPQQHEDVISIGPTVNEVTDTVIEIKDEDTESESTNPLSKTKLNKMNVAELQELCRQRGLNVEGAKKVLVDRLLGLTRD